MQAGLGKLLILLLDKNRHWLFQIIKKEWWNVRLEKKTAIKIAQFHLKPNRFQDEIK